MHVSIQTPQPIITFVCGTCVFVEAPDHRPKYRAHGVGWVWISNDNLVTPFRIQYIVPILRRFLRLNHVAVVNDHFRRLVSAIPAVFTIATRAGNLIGPAGLVWREQIFFGRGLKGCVCSAPPQISLRPVTFVAYTLQDFARTHVEKLYVYSGMNCLVTRDRVV